MKKMVRTIAAMQAAVMMLTSTAFAEELFDESMVFTEETAVMEETASMEAFDLHDCKSRRLKPAGRLRRGNTDRSS